MKEEEVIKMAIEHDTKDADIVIPLSRYSDLLMKEDILNGSDKWVAVKYEGHVTMGTNSEVVQLLSKRINELEAELAAKTSPAKSARGFWKRQ